MINTGQEGEGTLSADEMLETLAKCAAAIGVPLGKSQLALFAAYLRELLLWNRKINLVSERSSREIVLRHFLDSLTAVPFLDGSEGSLLDLGSGGGFPGIPLRIARPGLKVTLVEASRKKSSFESHVILTLGLEGITAVRARVEELASDPSWGGRFDLLISRAAFKLPELVQAGAFFLKPGGRLMAMKGPDPQEEMVETERILDSLSMALVACRDVPRTRANSSNKIVIYNRLFR
jgi:16S rRNA (guanine527-N7)-methyltransferase